MNRMRLVTLTAMTLVLLSVFDGVYLQKGNTSSDANTDVWVWESDKQSEINDKKDVPSASVQTKKDEPKKDEPKKDEPKKDEPKKDEPNVAASIDVAAPVLKIKSERSKLDSNATDRQGRSRGEGGYSEVYNDSPQYSEIVSTSVSYDGGSRNKGIYPANQDGSYGIESNRGNNFNDGYENPKDQYNPHQGDSDTQVYNINAENYGNGGKDVQRDQYQVNTDEGYIAAGDNSGTGSYGVVSDGSAHSTEYNGNEDEQYNPQKPKASYDDGEDGGRVSSEYGNDGDDKEGRFFSLSSLTKLLGFNTDKKRRPHHQQRPYGPPPFKRPPGYTPSDEGHHGGPPHHGGEHNLPHGVRPHHHPHNDHPHHPPHHRPPHHRPQHHRPPPPPPHRPPHFGHDRPHGNRPHQRPQDSYIPPKPAHSAIPQEYIPKPRPQPPSPTHQILDPYPNPDNHKPYVKPSEHTYRPRPSSYQTSGAIYGGQDNFHPAASEHCNCVPEYLCRKHDTIYHDGAGLIDERSKGDKKNVDGKKPSSDEHVAAVHTFKESQTTQKHEQDDEDLVASSSNHNDKYDPGVDIVLKGRSLEVKSRRDNDTEASGRSAGYVDPSDVNVQVDVKVTQNREPRIVNKDKGRHVIANGYGGGGPHHANLGPYGAGHGKPPRTCPKPLVCCKKPLFKASGLGKYFPQNSEPINHRPSHGRPRYDACGRRAELGVHERVKNHDHYEGETNFGDHPWQVAILQQQKPGASVYACGGVLVSPRHVLTVAHCIKKYYSHGRYNSDLKVRLGEYDVSTNAEPYGYQEIYVANVQIHPYYDPNLKNLHNDLAVIELKEPADIRQPHITPVCLPNSHTEFNGRRCVVTGWGKNAFGYEGKYQSRLKQVDVPVLHHGDCEERLRHTRLGPQFKLHHGFVCAGGEYGKDACTGDGGSPLVCRDDYGTWQLAGLVSWGIGCGEQHVPGIYVKVSHYYDWLAPLIRY